MSKPGVVGRLASCTVSSAGGAPLGARMEPFRAMLLLSWSSESLGGGSFFCFPELLGGVAVRSTTILGADWVDCGGSGLVGRACCGCCCCCCGCWERSELRRERLLAGGGDLRRGETGQWGVLSPELVDLLGLETRVESAAGGG